LAVPGFAVGERALGDGGAAVHEEDHARQSRQRQRGAVRQDVFRA
jgi:hypothetical protein